MYANNHESLLRGGFMSAILLIVLLAFVGPGLADAPPTKRKLDRIRDADTKSPRRRVGQVHIVGNRNVSDSIILEQCPLFPGGEYSSDDLRDAEQRLAGLHLFVVDRKRGIRPTVKPLRGEEDSSFVDIRVEVVERPDVKQMLLLREGMSFVIDYQGLGLIPALDRATGFSEAKLTPRVMQGLDKLADAFPSVFGKFKRRCVGFTAPPAVGP